MPRLDRGLVHLFLLANLRVILLSNFILFIVSRPILAESTAREKRVGRSLRQIENNRNGASQHN
jgi:hypothetical protein